MCCGGSPTMLQLLFIPPSELKSLEKTRHFHNMIHWVLAMHLPCVWRHESHLQYVWQLKSGSWATRQRVDGAALPDGKCSARPRGECLGTEPDTHEGSAWVSHLAEVLPRWFRSKGSADGVSAHPRALRSPQTRLAWPNHTFMGTHFSFFRQIIPSSTAEIPPSLPAWVFVSSHHFRIWSPEEFFPAQMELTLGIMLLKLQVP